MAKKTNLNLDKEIIAKIPYVNVYEENMIQSAPGLFVKNYRIEAFSPEDLVNFRVTDAITRIKQMINGIHDDITIQFTVFNTPVDKEDYLKNIQLDSNNSILKPYIDAYNHVVNDMSTIGYNNIVSKRFITLGVKADIADEAMDMFHQIDSELHELFRNIYDCKITELTTIEQMEILYQMFNPNSNEFGKRADMRNDGTFTFENMKYMKLTTKDVVGPSSFNSSKKLKNHIILNEKHYARTFFINNLPSKIADGFITDITNTTSNMIYSIVLESLDAQFGFDVFVENVKENTTVSTVVNRNTIAEKKNKITTTKTELITYDEQAYFNQEALDVLKRSVAANENIFCGTMVIVLYANSLENLERDTNLLKISASKFACQVKCLDSQQLQGFQTALPLCNIKIDVRRTLDSEKAAMLIPMDFNSVIKMDGIYTGVNAVNDNLILLNRKNNSIKSGIISGVAHSGKTYQMKKEIFNALISTNDDVIVINTGNTDEYSSFANKLNGVVISDGNFNIKDIESGYGVTENDKVFKDRFYEGLVHLMNPAMNKELTRQVVSDNTWYEPASQYIGKNDNTSHSRLTIYNSTTPIDTYILIEQAWLQIIRNLKQNKYTWLFIDNIDTLVLDIHAFSFIRELIAKCNALNVITTMVVQDSIVLFNTSNHDFENMLQEAGYIKLLNQSVIERKKYVELLNIPNPLISYISNVGIGKGIIITNSSNIPFDDSYVDTENEKYMLYHNLFEKKIKQITV